jgi:hypothetical protein
MYVQFSSLTIFLDHVHQIGKGSDMARGDDTASLKHAIIEWIHDLFGTSLQHLDTKNKIGRGLSHDHCGKLLCPIEYDWSDLRCVDIYTVSHLANLLSSVRTKIREGHPNYVVTAHSWPKFIYAGFEANVDDMENGLFHSELLVMVFFLVFHAVYEIID